MKKINTILAAASALLMLTVTSANSVEFKAGVSVNGMAAYANAKETLKGDGDGTGGQTGRTTNAEALMATTFASVFAEVSTDEAMGLGIGISYAPEVIDLPKETRQVNQCNDQTGRRTGAACTNKTGDSADSGTQVIDGKVQDLLSIYLTMPISDTGAYVKAGYIQATMITSENLATGSKYENIDLTGTQVGAGYEGSIGDMAFWRAEGTYQMWDDISANGSESNATTTDTTKNKIEAELGSVSGSLSIGMRF